MKVRPPKLTRKTIVIGTVVLAVATAGGVVAYRQLNTDNAKPVAEGGKGYINYDAPTEEEKAAAEQRKKEIVAQNEERERNKTSPGEKRSVTPVITSPPVSSQQVTIMAYVPNVFEDGGTCSLTLTQGGQVVTKQSEAFANATNTSCAPLFVDVPTKGQWNVVVKYTSSSSEGTSQTQELRIE